MKKITDPSHSPLHDQVRELCEQEHAIRRRCFIGPDYFARDLSELERHHARVAKEIGQVIDREHWPGFLRLGHDLTRALTELTRLCWSEPRFMRRALPLIEHSYRVGDLWGDWFAKIYDTIMFFENKPQVYGTLLIWGETQLLVPWKIIEPENVLVRRAAVLMEEHERYVRNCIQQTLQAGIVPPVHLKEYHSALAAWALARGWKRVSGP